MGNVMQILNGIRQPGFRQAVRPQFGLIIPGLQSTTTRPTATWFAGPPTDVLERSTGKASEGSNPVYQAGQTASPVTKAANVLKKLLTPGPDQKETASVLLKAAAGKSLPPTDGLDPTTRKQAEAKRLGESIHHMSSADKVQLVREMTGQGSPYGEVAAKLLARQAPTMKDWLNLFRPRPEAATPNVAGSAVQVAGLGMLMLSVVAPAALVAQPALIGKLISTLALKLL
jgi:hypothetical protein